MGVSGSSEIVAVVRMASGSVSCRDGRRHGVVPVTLLGDMVSVMAYVSRR